MSRVKKYVINDKSKIEEIVTEATYKKMLVNGEDYDYDIETNLMQYRSRYSFYIYIMLLTIILLTVGIVVGNYYINKPMGTSYETGEVYTKQKGKGEQVKIEKSR